MKSLPKLNSGTIWENLTKLRELKEKFYQSMKFSKKIPELLEIMDYSSNINQEPTDITCTENTELPH